MRAISLRWLSVLLVTVMVHTLAVFAQTPQAPAPAPNDALRALLGADDNAALAIMYGGETRGNIDTCGWRAHPMGGLARRVSYLQAFRKTFAQTQVIELNAGYSLNDAGVMANPPLKDIAVQNTYALRAYSRFPFDAFNISFHDLAVLSQYLEKAHQKANFAEFPALKTLVSANLTPEVDQKTHLPIAPYIIRELKSPRFPKGKLRVGITGFSEPAPAANQGYVWREVEKTATEVLPELRKKVDLVVVMAYLPVDQAQNLCRNHPEIDICIAAYNKVFQAPIEKFGNAQFVMSNYETKNLGELRISFGPKGELTVTNRFVPLDSQIPDEPAAGQLVQETKAAVDAAQKAMVQQMQNH